MKHSLRKALREAYANLPPAAKQQFAEFGRKGGKKGGKVRASRMTPKERSEAARKAVQVRWARVRQRNRQD